MLSLCCTVILSGHILQLLFPLPSCSVQVSNPPDRDPSHQQHKSPQGSRLQGQSAGTLMCDSGADAMLKVQRPAAAAVLFIKAVLL